MRVRKKCTTAERAFERSNALDDITAGNMMGFLISDYLSPGCQARQKIYDSAVVPKAQIDLLCVSGIMSCETLIDR